jgi:hypothetical protein
MGRAPISLRTPSIPRTAARTLGAHARRVVYTTAFAIRFRGRRRRHLRRPRTQPSSSAKLFRLSVSRK